MVLDQWFSSQPGGLVKSVLDPTPLARVADLVGV